MYQCVQMSDFQEDNDLTERLGQTSDHMIDRTYTEGTVQILDQSWSTVQSMGP